MADINTATLIGRLCRDAELRYTANGMPIGEFSVAINRKVKRDGQWVDEANFFDVTVFGKQAENLKPYLTKGKQVGVTGFLKQDRWKDQQGNNRSKVGIVANDLMLLGGRSDGSSQQGGYDDGYGTDDAGGYGYGA